MLLDLLKQLIYSPPATLIAILVTIIVSHLLHPIIPFITRDERSGGLIFILEILMSFLLAVLTLKAFLMTDVKETASHQNSNPYNMLVIFIIVTFASMIVYLWAKSKKL